MTAQLALLLYLVFAAGAVALYLLMPRGQTTGRAAGVLIAVAALLGLLIHFELSHPATGSAVFYLASIIALAAATRVITHTRPVYSAIYFVLVIVAVAAILVLQAAEFLAVALIIVYAGAILVTYLFVIMLAQQSQVLPYDLCAREPLLAILAGFSLAGAIAAKAVQAVPAPPSAPASSLVQSSNTLGVGAVIMTKYLVVLELAGILLLISLVGALALSRKKVPPEPYLGTGYTLGVAGKKAEPF